MAFHRRLSAALALATIALVACGNADDSGRPPTVVLSLDFVPNAVHAPIYMGVRNGRDREAGIRLQIRKPAGGPDALKLVASGRVHLGVLDIHDLAIARQQGTDLVAVGALVGRPLAALIARPGISRPRDLEGRRVGVSGLPSDPAFLRAILEHDGGDYERVRQVTIGFAAVSRLLSRRVDAVPAFWNAEGIALKRRGLAVREFRVDDYGAPPYPEVVLITSRRTLTTRPDVLRRALKAIERGLRDTLTDREAAAQTIAKAAESSDVDLIRAQLSAVAPVFARGLKLDRDVIAQWADFDARIGLVQRRPDVARAFDFELLGARQLASRTRGQAPHSSLAHDDGNIEADSRSRMRPVSPVPAALHPRRFFTPARRRAAFPAFAARQSRAQCPYDSSSPTQRRWRRGGVRARRRPADR